MRPIFAENILSPATKNVFIYKAKISGAAAFVTTQISERGLYYNFMDDLGASDSNIVLMFDSAGNLVSQNRSIDEKNIFEFLAEIRKEKSELSLTLSGENFFGAFVEMPLSHYTILLLVNRKKVDGKIFSCKS